jgi:hypothetical protein
MASPPSANAVTWSGSQPAAGRTHSIDPDGLSAVRTYFEKLWNAALASYAALVNQSEGKKQ